MNFWQARMLAKKRAAKAWHLYERNALVPPMQPVTRQQQPKEPSNDKR